MSKIIADEVPNYHPICRCGRAYKSEDAVGHDHAGMCCYCSERTVRQSVNEEVRTDDREIKSDFLRR